MTVSFCGSLATTCASSFQHAFIGNSAALQWSDVRLTGTYCHQPQQACSEEYSQTVESPMITKRNGVSTTRRGVTLMSNGLSKQKQKVVMKHLLSKTLCVTMLGAFGRVTKPFLNAVCVAFTFFNSFCPFMVLAIILWPECIACDPSMTI